MKILKNKLRNSLNIRTEKDYPVEGIEFIDITPLILQKETLKEMIDAFVSEIKDKSIDYIVAPEARGFLLGSAVALNLNIGCVPVRKKGKLPPTVVEAQVEYEKEYGKDILEIPKLVDDEYKNRNFYIIDDIYATGNTNKAIKDVIQKLGGNVVGEAVVMNIVELNDNKELFSLIDITED
jgi:adenine phosphoribosyltransferase